ncbi:uncharacterized protein LOC122256318 [Penaeus japonicus]|uniref:uncharacterized protein LOC122256318 n=1 Tax=Penaeus japonicus TaxID=27405 RepID=UPI001C7120B5|nr:uncharacterized protein LOC122256318 [Penaeus japonicus]
MSTLWILVLCVASASVSHEIAISTNYNDPELPQDELQAKCRDKEGEICGYCKQMVTCDSSGPTSAMCGKGMWCRTVGSGVETNAGCFSECPECQCPEVGQDGRLFPDPLDPRTYFVCDKFALHGQRFYRCPPGTHFDAQSEACELDPPTTPALSTTTTTTAAHSTTTPTTTTSISSTNPSSPSATPTLSTTTPSITIEPTTPATVSPGGCSSSTANCTSEGEFSFPLSCQEYYDCAYDSSSGSYRPSCYICPDEEAFYPGWGCQNPLHFDCGGKEGRFQEVSDCRKYHECILVGEVMYHEVIMCPSGQAYDEALGSCTSATCADKCTNVM